MELTGAGFTAAVRIWTRRATDNPFVRPGGGGNAVLSPSCWRLTAVTQQIVLAIGSFVLALPGTLLLSALSLVVARSGSCYRSFRSETEVRALTLLKGWLSPKQRACYDRFRYFDVIGSDTGTRYRIHYGTQTNIEELSSTG